MYILEQTSEKIMNAEAITRYVLIRKSDCVLIGAVFNSNTVPTTLGSYATWEEARGVMIELFDSLRGGQSYAMPLSRVVAPEQEVHDARTRRRGGS